MFSTVASEKDTGLSYKWAKYPSVRSLYVLPVSGWVPSGFLPASKAMHVRLTVDSILSLGVNVSMSV